VRRIGNKGRVLTLTQSEVELQEMEQLVRAGMLLHVGRCGVGAYAGGGRGFGRRGFILEEGNQNNAIYGEN
jgi:hypothetical protein